MEGFLCYKFGGLIFGEAYFRTLTILFRDAETQILNKYLTTMCKSNYYFGHLQSYALTLSSTSLPSKS